MISSRWIAALLVVLLIGTGAPTAWADERSQSTEPTAGATAAAVVSDIFYVPGKAILCGASGALWIATMAVTFGTLYQEATDFVRGGCGGKWVLTGEDIKPAAQSY